MLVVIPTGAGHLGVCQIQECRCRCFAKSNSCTSARCTSEVAGSMSRMGVIRIGRDGRREPDSSRELSHHNLQ
jgi:hypothetical protein